MHSCIHLVVNLVVGRYSLYQRGRISTYPKGRYILRTHQRGILYREVYVVGYLSHSDQRQRGRQTGKLSNRVTISATTTYGAPVTLQGLILKGAAHECWA